MSTHALHWRAAQGDIAPLVNAACVAAAISGGTVALPAGAFTFASTLVIPARVRVVGAGAANFGQCATTLTWTGASGGVMITVGSDTASTVVAGAGLSHVQLDGAGIAGTGIKLRSVCWSWFENILITRVTAVAWDIDVGAVANIGNMFNHFVRTYAVLVDASCITAGGWLIGPGSATANTNRNVWDDLIVNYLNGIGMDFGNADSNDVRAAHVETTGDTPGTSLYLRGHASSIIRTARSNRFEGEFGNSNITASRVVAGTGTYPSVNNLILLNQESGAPAPVRLSNATLVCTTRGGLTL